MALRDDVHQLVDQLAEDELRDAHALLEGLRAQERATEVLAAARDAAVDAWQREAIREGLAYAASEDAQWVADEDILAWLDSWGTDQELPPPPAQRRG
jgi:predicted transcriptional regulator